MGGEALVFNAENDGGFGFGRRELDAGGAQAGGEVEGQREPVAGGLPAEAGQINAGLVGQVEGRHHRAQWRGGSPADGRCVEVGAHTTLDVEQRAAQRHNPLARKLEGARAGAAELAPGVGDEGVPRVVVVADQQRRRDVDVAGLAATRVAAPGIGRLDRQGLLGRDEILDVS